MTVFNQLIALHPRFTWLHVFFSLQAAGERKCAACARSFGSQIGQGEQ